MSLDRPEYTPKLAGCSTHSHGERIIHAHDDCRGQQCSEEEKRTGQGTCGTRRAPRIPRAS